MISFIFFLIVAAVCAMIADAVVPGHIPGGFLTAVIFGLIGGWLGSMMMGNVGPQLAGVALLPTMVGSAALIFGLAVVSGTLHGKAA